MVGMLEGKPEHTLVHKVEGILEPEGTQARKLAGIQERILVRILEGMRVQNFARLHYRCH